MTRLPFDPDRAHGAKPSGVGSRGSEADRAPLTVSQLSDLIKMTLERTLPASLRVAGEVSNFSARNHWYFSLKDEAAVVSCVAWATAIRKFGFTPKDGDQVVATGHISHFGPQGRTQLYVTKLEPVGAGSLELRFRALCEELRKLGYFDEARKRPLPLFPKQIAIITSATGAAIQDVINTAAHRCRAVGLLIVDVRVQGEGAATEIARAVRWVDTHHQRLGVDAILVTRGGGSIEDLWAFNERVVADAVFKCTVPVVAAIGHESDTTIIELVADRRASTPTQAAMLLVPSSQELQAQVRHLNQRLLTMLSRRFEQARNHSERSVADLRRIITEQLGEARTRLAELVSRLNEIQPVALVASKKARLEVLSDRLTRSIQDRIDLRERVQQIHIAIRRAIHRKVQRSRDQLHGAERHLLAVDPHGVLRRGYSLTTHLDGRLIRSIRQVAKGERLRSRLSDGTVESIASGSNASAGDSAKRRRSGPANADQMDLFNTSR